MSQVTLARNRSLHFLDNHSGHDCRHPATRILHLEPVGRAAGAIRRVLPLPVTSLLLSGQQTVVGSFEQGGLDGAGIYFLWGSYWFWVRRRRHASNRANPGRQDVLLSSLRSTLFGDVLAAFQE